MGVVIALTRRPDLILPLLRLYADTGLGLLVWYLDMLVSFLVLFAVVYGAFALVGRLFPAPLGAKPRVWRVPVVFGAVAAGFFLGGDGAVSDVLRNVLESLSLIPGVFLMRVAGCVWVLGAAVCLWRAVFGILRVSRAAGRLALCDDAAVLEVLRRAAADAGVAGRGVALRAGAAGGAIFSCGLWRACIVVPGDFSARYSPEEQYAILLHECVHVRRRDSFVLLCMAVVGAVLWFDPVVRRALRRMKGDMELFCDWVAVRSRGVSPELYAGLIVGAASGGREFSAGFSEEYRAVAQRLGHVLRDAGLFAPSRLSRRRAGGGLAVLGAGVVAAAVYYMGLEPVPVTPPESVRGSQGEVLGYEERHGVFSMYGFAYTLRGE